ncbi:MAG: peptidase S41 [Acidobacteria bacterium]|nr:peptidase S41 [Acidobacteriota bacterium]
MFSNLPNWTRQLSLVPIILFFCFSTLANETPAATVIKAADLQTDLAVLRKAYEEMHPGLYRYNTKAEMDAHFGALKSELNRDQTLREAYLAISLFLAKIKCGHSYANFYNQPKSVVEELFKGQTRVPFYFRWIEKRIIVSKNFSTDPRLKPGTEVLTINDTPVKVILDKLMQVARADGSNDGKRVNYLDVTGTDNYEAFDVFHPLFFPFKSTTIDLTIRQEKSLKPAKVAVTALTYEERLTPIKAGVEAVRDSEAVFEFKYLDEKTAYLRMPTWGLYNSKWDWKKYLKGVFDELALEKTANLIVDIRENEGGNDIGDEVISRLIDKELMVEAAQRFVRYRKASADLEPYLDTWDPSFKDWGSDATESGNGFYKLSRFDDEKGAKVFQPAGPRFEGKTFVLVSATNSSATFQFAQIVKQNKLATLVGQTTGGNQRGINGGAFFFLRLPNSKIEVDLPLIAAFPKDVPDAGVEPDIYVRQSIADIAAGRDSELEATLAAIRSKSR